VFEHRSGQTKDYKIGIGYFSAKHEALRRNSKDWFARNQDNVSEWGDMSIHGLLFQLYIYPTKRVGLVQSELHHHLIEN
jgi:predicted LPLAT superfamily acyltransferase